MSLQSLHVLIVDDEDNQRQLLRSICERMGVQVDEATDGDAAVERCRAQSYDLVFMDMKMERMDGLQALRHIHQFAPQQKVLILTAFGSVKTAVEAMKHGAFDYLTKPYDMDEIKGFLERVGSAEVREAADRAETERMERMRRFGIIGRSPLIRKLFEDMELIGPTDATVLIQGESGTGKGLIAEALCQLSKRRTQPFLRVNCGAITETLLESELFGIEKNVATGVSGRKGMFELANSGTIFLDEVGDMSPKLQVKLLHVLQDRKFMRVGGSANIEVDVRVIAATNKDLFQMVQEGQFREDLYYRLNVVSLTVVPLRDRPEDIPMLIEHFLQRSVEKNHKQLKGFHKEAMQLMLSYAWPGNVRELENAIERGVILARHERILSENLPLSLRKGLQDEATKPTELPSFSIKKLERDAIIKALRMTQGNRTDAAKLLGISRRTLQYKLKEYSIEDQETSS